MACERIIFKKKYSMRAKMKSEYRRPKGSEEYKNYEDHIKSLRCIWSIAVPLL